MIFGRPREDQFGPSVVVGDFLLAIFPPSFFPMEDGTCLIGSQKVPPPRVLGLDIYVEVAAPHARIQARPRKVEECIGSGKGNIRLKTVPADDCGVDE